MITPDHFVQLAWQTATELNNQRFEIERKTDLQRQWSKIGEVKGNGTRITAHQYSFIDKYLEMPGQYFYRLKQIDFDGTYTYSKETSVLINQQNQVEVIPIRSEIRISIPNDQYIRIGVYDILGREVELLINQTLPKGTYLYSWNPQSSGIYFYYIQSDFGQEAKKIVIVR